MEKQVFLILGWTAPLTSWVHMLAVMCSCVVGRLSMEKKRFKCSTNWKGWDGCRQTVISRFSMDLVWERREERERHVGADWFIFFLNLIIVLYHLSFCYSSEAPWVERETNWIYRHKEHEGWQRSWRGYRNVDSNNAASVELIRRLKMPHAEAAAT